MRLFFSDDDVAMSHSIDATKKPSWIAKSVEQHPIPGVSVETPTPARRKQLERVHSSDYIDAVETGEPRELAESSTFPWDERTWISEVTVNTTFHVPLHWAVDTLVQDLTRMGLCNCIEARSRSQPLVVIPRNNR